MLTRIVRLALGWPSPSLMMIGTCAIKGNGPLDRWERHVMRKAGAVESVGEEFAAGSESSARPVDVVE